MEIRPSILDAIGNTPLVRLSRIHPPGNLVAKVEYVNPGGSTKDRIGLLMIEAAERDGLLAPGGTIVEPTSGNTGVGLAMVAAIKGYRLVCVMPDKMSQEKIDGLRAYGAEVHVAPTDVAPDDPRSYYSVAARLVSEIPGAFSPNQYANDANPEAHYRSTGPEIWDQTDGTVDQLVVGVGTGGTITGTARFLKERNPAIQVVGVDPVGSIYTADSDDDVHTYLTEGVGEDFWPDTFDRTLVDRFIRVSDREAYSMARRLAATEGVLVGSSGGLATVGALRVAAGAPDDLVVVILPDSGRSYVSKVFNDTWMADHGLLEEE
ncbi:MAG: pyridoxal-phosphate dependent enzyme [Acidimicrobiia bacterium]|nr:pyridoxal-phosphate dependent enzyme [Acidimicrobiia bacterium]MBT8248221.1 pyridoxal-phosphate dependent enzyme [Acidimicrobiia bacterium]NNF89468.1 pyridoxal-phosphate dependent enzyme [Acidimicrobiia bacterium]NNL12468.1 pyridoxal-phosphate dependent enzyme [Acidimicrobiia bacterium]RZV46257.1 MAG: pyridoxal-phosphate dependent enzyme [Acidimicrobiia bacterium]